MTTLPTPHAIVMRARAEGLKMNMTHVRILEALLEQKGKGIRPLTYDTLSLAIGSTSSDPRRVLATRIPPLRKALEPYALTISNFRNSGYGLCEIL